MCSFALSELEQPLRARLHGVDARFSGVSTDTRDICEGDLFVALQGPSYDAHDFVGEAREGGACAALVSKPGRFPLPALEVEDTLVALGELAALNREQFRGSLLAVTGSCGKTSVKNMLNSILSQRGNCLATQGNLNNEIGVPLTLLRLNASHQYAVVEMGAGKGGDIGYLCQLGKPDISLLLNAMPAHLQGFGSVDEVAVAKGEILSGCSADGVAVFNADSPYADLWRELAGGRRTIEFGLEKPAAVAALQLEERGLQGSQFVLSTPAGDIAVRLAMPGRHNVANALAAAAGALALNVPLRDIASGLSNVQAVAGRMQVQIAPGGARIIDDSYNANPGSVEAAIDLLAALPGERILVLGDMGELGSESQELHARVGAYARAQGIDECWLAGKKSRETARGYGEDARYFATVDELIDGLRGHHSGDAVVLVKGSRSAGMEAVVQSLLAGGEG